MTAEILTTDCSPALTAAANAVTSDSCELPVLPEVAVELLKLTADIQCDPADIVNLFKRDQSLTAHLLKVTNSARYSTGQTVTSTQHAVARLGLLQVREVVMLISCQSKIFNVDAFEADVRRSFERSLTTAAFSQELARVRRVNVEEAFLSGLLHDVGRPVLLQELSDWRADLDTECSDDDVRAAAETYRIPMATRLIRLWELPDRVGDIIELQEHPLSCEGLESEASMLCLAMDLAQITLVNGSIPDGYSHPMVDVLNLYPEDLTTVADKAEAILEWVKASI